MVSPNAEIILSGFRGRRRGMGRGRGDGLDLEYRGCTRGHSIHWKKEVKICQLASQIFLESKCPNSTRIIVIEQKKLTASLLIFQRGSSELSAILAEMANFWAFVVWYKTAQLVSSHLFRTESHMEFKIIHF